MRKTLNAVRSKAYLIIAGAFLLGVLTGSLLMNLVVAGGTVTTKGSVINDLATELNLSSDQKVKIEEIYKDSKKEGKEIFKIIQPQMDNLNEQTKAKVKLHLNSEQIPLYNKWCFEKETAKKRAQESK